jgi:hypothetical protein
LDKLGFGRLPGFSVPVTFVGPHFFLSSSFLSHRNQDKEPLLCRPLVPKWALLSSALGTVQEKEHRMGRGRAWALLGLRRHRPEYDMKPGRTRVLSMPYSPRPGNLGIPLSMFIKLLGSQHPLWTTPYLLDYNTERRAESSR